MMEAPYKKGDTVSLNQEYEIAKLLSETEKYWLFEAIQSATLKKVKVIVYNNDSFSSSIDVEMEWKSDAEIIEKQSEFLGEPVKFIESGVKMDGGKLQYVIIFSSVKEIPQPTPVVTEKVEEVQVEGDALASPKKTILSVIDDLEEADPANDVTAEEPVTTVADALKESEVKHKDFTVEEGEEEVDDDDFAEELLETADEMDVPEEIIEAEEFIEAPIHPNEVEMKPAGVAPKTASTPSVGFAKRKQKKESAAKEAVPEMLEEQPATSDAPLRDEMPTELEKEILDERKDEAERTIEIEDEEEKDYVKHIVMDYFDRMNPSNYYPLKLKISDIKKAVSAKMVNPITGERKISERDELEATLRDPIVIVRPSILGCSVMPGEIETNFDDEEDELTFYVTPGVKGKVIGSIDFINENEIIHKTTFKAKVVDPNYARVVAFYGILASFTPKIIGFLGLNLGLEDTLETLWGVTSTVFSGMSIAGLIALGGIVPVVILSLAVRWKLKPSEGKLKFNLTNFRLKDLKMKKTKA